MRIFSGNKDTIKLKKFENDVVQTALDKWKEQNDNASKVECKKVHVKFIRKLRRK